MASPDPATTEWVPVWSPFNTGPIGPQGPPGISAPHHATHETGGTDAIVALAGEVITTGIVADARLSSNVALKNINNLFSSEQSISVSGGARFQLVDPSQAADLRVWRIVNTGTFLRFHPVNDAGASLLTALELNRSGNVLTNGAFSAASASLTTPLPVTSGGTGVNNIDMCSIFNSASGTQSVAAVVLYKVTFTSEEFDTNAMHDPAVNPSRITIKRAGKYMISGGIFWSVQPIGNTDLLLCGISKNGTIIPGIRSYFPPISGFASRGQAQNVAGITQCAVNDYIELCAYQEDAPPVTANAALNIDQQSCSLQVAWIGP